MLVGASTEKYLVINAPTKLDEFERYLVQLVKMVYCWSYRATKTVFYAMRLFQFN